MDLAILGLTLIRIHFESGKMVNIIAVDVSKCLKEIKLPFMFLLSDGKEDYLEKIFFCSLSRLLCMSTNAFYKSNDLHTSHARIVF